MILDSDIGAQKTFRSTKVDLEKWLRVFGVSFSPGVGPLHAFVVHKDRAVTKLKGSCCLQMIEMLALDARRKDMKNLHFSTVCELTTKLWTEWEETKSR